MASMIQKQLAEFLKEQQEPFVLEAYLLERGCCYHSQKNRFHSSDVRSGHFSSTVAKPSCLKKSFSWGGLKRNQKFLPNCSKVVRTLFTKLVTVHVHQKKIRHQNTCAADIKDKGRHEIADEDRFSSSTSSATTTVFNSCSESDAEHTHSSPAGNSDIVLAADHQESPEVVYVLTENEVVAGWKFRWRNGEDSKQLSPVSVLEETESESYGDSPVEDEFMTKQKGELDMKKSVSRYKEEKEKPIYKKRTDEEVQDFDGSNSNSSNNNVSSHYSKNKKAVQQTKQLLFDCIREVVELEKHKKKNGSSEGQQLKGIVGSEQLWELICENLCLWSKESINETNVIHLPHSEVLLVSSAQEWKCSDLEKQTQVIGSQLGDAILEDICNEIILEMIIFCTDK